MARPQSLQETLPGLRRIIHRFWPYVRRRRALVIGSMLALFAEVALRLLEPWPLKFVFDRIIASSPGGGRSGIPAVDALSPTALLALAAGALVVITGLRALADYANTVGFALIGNRVLTEVRDDLFRHLQRLSLTFYGKARGGDLIVRVISDVGILKDVVVSALLPLLARVFILAGMVAVMFWLNWQLTLVSLAIVPFFWLRAASLSRRIQHVAGKQRHQEGALAATAAETIGAMKVVQVFSLQGKFSQAFVRQNRRSLSEGVKASRLQAALERSIDLLVAVATALVLFAGARLVLRHALTPGDLLVFLAYLRSALRPVRDFAKYTGRLAKATASGERILDLLERSPEVRDLPGAASMPAARGAVRFERVWFEYEPDQPVLRDVEFETSPGQLVALVGPSGAGKSTLVSLIPRLFDPTAGRVLIDGRDIRAWTVESLRNQISIVLQDSILFAASVRDNIAFGAVNATDDDIEAAARAANAHEFVETMPQGYETVIGERGVTLSHGQRQRIAIARAMVRRGPILILDEPTLGLDEENERVVVEALERLARGRTTFLITHDPQLASRADFTVVLDGGRVVEQVASKEHPRAVGR